MFKKEKMFKLIICVSIFFLLITLYGCNNVEETSLSENEIEDEENILIEEVSIKKPKIELITEHIEPKNIQHSKNDIDITVHKNVYDYFKFEAPREIYGSEADFWKMLVSNKNDEYIMKEIVDNAIQKANGEENKAVNILVKLVQNIPYGKADLKGEWNQYPYETLYSFHGTCGDRAVLLARLLKVFNYSVSLLIYDKAEHMAVGIKGNCPLSGKDLLPSEINGFRLKGGYCYTEATGNFLIGEKPKGISVLKPSEIIIINEGKNYNRE